MYIYILGGMLGSSSVQLWGWNCQIMKIHQHPNLKRHTELMHSMAHWGLVDPSPRWLAKLQGGLSYRKKSSFEKTIKISIAYRYAIFNHFLCQITAGYIAINPEAKASPQVAPEKDLAEMLQKQLMELDTRTAGFWVWPWGAQRHKIWNKLGVTRPGKHTYRAIACYCLNGQFGNSGFTHIDSMVMFHSYGTVYQRVYVCLQNSFAAGAKMWIQDDPSNAGRFIIPYPL